MTKRITAKIEEYEKNGEIKGKYVDIGVILNGQHGEFVMLNPTVDLSGVLMKQRLLAQKNNGKPGDNVMCSIFDNDQQQSPQQDYRGHSGSNQANPTYQQPARQQQAPANDFSDDIPW